MSISIPPLFAAGRLKLMLLLICIGITQAVATIASSLLAKTVFDQILTAQTLVPNRSLLIWGAGFCGLAALIGCLTWAERVVAEKIGQVYAEAVRLSLYDRLATLQQRVLQQRSQGAVMLRFVGDLTAVRQWVSLGLARLTVIALTTIGSLTALALINGVLAATVSIVLLVGAAFSLGRGWEMRATTRESRRRMARLAANINEKIGTLSVLQVFGQAGRERKRLVRQSRQLRIAMVSKAKASGKINGLAEGFAAFAHGVALVVGAIQVNSHQTSPGTVIAALTVVSLLVPRLRHLGRVQEYWHGFNVSRQKMLEFLNLPAHVIDQPDAEKLKRGAGKLEFKSVSLSSMLQNISVTAAAGSVIAIVGPNGAGKSTLLALAARLLTPDHGAILLDDQDISKHSLASLHKLIGVAGPDFPLLRGTLERNLMYRRPRASEAERARVYKLCGLDEVLAALPKGEQTRIAEGGKGLSAGQSQRIALARALLGNPALLLLDEADANLDSQAAMVIDEVLAGHQGTVLLVTHRRERIAKADQVWFFEGGRLLEVGTPAQVFSGSGPTARFFAPQKITNPVPQRILTAV